MSASGGGEGELVGSSGDKGGLCLTSSTGTEAGSSGLGFEGSSAANDEDLAASRAEL